MHGKEVGRKALAKHFDFCPYIAGIVFYRNDLLKAQVPLGQVNVWIFLVIILPQFMSYYASGEMIFSYLKARGDLKGVPSIEKPKNGSRVKLC